jgi:hypothetical protein
MKSPLKTSLQKQTQMNSKANRMLANCRSIKYMTAKKQNLHL